MSPIACRPTSTSSRRRSNRGSFSRRPPPPSKNTMTARNIGRRRVSSAVTFCWRECAADRPLPQIVFRSHAFDADTSRPAQLISFSRHLFATRLPCKVFTQTRGRVFLLPTVTRRVQAMSPQRNPISVREIDHLVLRVIDLERMLSFYCDVL